MRSGKTSKEFKTSYAPPENIKEYGFKAQGTSATVCSGAGHPPLFSSLYERCAPRTAPAGAAASHHTVHRNSCSANPAQVTLTSPKEIKWPLAVQQRQGASSRIPAFERQVKDCKVTPGPRHGLRRGARSRAATAAQPMSSPAEPASLRSGAGHTYPSSAPLFVWQTHSASKGVAFGTLREFQTQVWEALWIWRERVNLMYRNEEKGDQRTVTIKPRYERAHESQRFALLPSTDFLL